MAPLASIMDCRSSTTYVWGPCTTHPVSVRFSCQYVLVLFRRSFFSSIYRLADLPRCILRSTKLYMYTDLALAKPRSSSCIVHVNTLNARTRVETSNSKTVKFLCRRRNRIKVSFLVPRDLFNTHRASRFLPFSMGKWTWGERATRRSDRLANPALGI